jgi:NAD(P)-dependent dehydrogenase (short-subunit alcohol dehydrogenase family)
MVRTHRYDEGVREEAAARGVSFEQIIAAQQATIPMGAFVPPEDVGALVAFLASESARYITGAEFVVDGGIVHCDTSHWE